MADTNGSYNSERLDRIERMIEVVVSTQAGMKRDVNNLYRPQGVMGETLHRLAEAQRELDVALNEMAGAQKQADEHMDALLRTVDEIFRGRKRE